jgi:methionyl-tRNA synthetase
LREDNTELPNPLKKPKRYLITAALPYANGPLHIGHIAGAHLPPDIYARYLRLRRKEVAFVCGSDEHGAAITLKAKKENVSPKAIVDQYHEQIKKTFAEFGISFDIYHRTSSQLHHETAADFFLELHNKGAFTKEESTQFYDEDFNQFLADRYIKGTCPKCSNENAFGDQCEKCGSSLNPSDLIKPVSTLSGKPPVMKPTFHWYLPMQDHSEWLKQWIENGILEGRQLHNPHEWKKHVVGQCLSWIDGGLGPRAVTRDLDWGVKVPLEGAEGKVLYVWVDAPIGYISATKQWAADTGKQWKPYWQDADTKMVHFIGKDNIVFHCIIFPILLKAHGDYILPENVPANEFLNLEGDKISTSRNWAVWLHEYLEDFPGRQDELRYVLCSIAPENKDSEFTWKDFQARVNNELVAIYGNFVNRAMVLTQKYFDGKVPAKGSLLPKDLEVEKALNESIDKVAIHIEAYRFREALFEAMNMARIGNKYLADTEPWKLIKVDEERVKTILNTALQIAGKLSIAFSPFLPFTSHRLALMLNLAEPSWEQLNEELILEEGHALNKPELLFKKVEDEEVEKQTEKLNASKASQNKPSKHQPMKAPIQFGDFMQLDIRTGSIVSAEKVENADKLLQLKVDTGLDVRTIVSGIAEHFTPEEVVGRQVSVLMNLEPRKIRGVESQGMILMAEDEDGKLAFVAPPEGYANGSIVR